MAMPDCNSSVEPSVRRAGRPRRTLLKVAGAAAKAVICLALLTVLGVTIGQPLGRLFGGEAGRAAGRRWGWIAEAIFGLAVTRRAKVPFFQVTTKEVPLAVEEAATSEAPEPIAGGQERPADSLSAESAAAERTSPRTILVNALLFGGIGLMGGAMLSVVTFLVWSSVALSPWAPADWGPAVSVGLLTWSTSHPAAFWVLLGPIAACTTAGLIGGAIWGSTRWAFR